jgi:hypothetical protein
MCLISEENNTTHYTRAYVYLAVYEKEVRSTFKDVNLNNNRKVKTAVHGWLRMQEPDF